MVSWGKIERRHDARFYLPHFVRLEEKVRAKTNRKLRDYCLAMAGGATPKAEETELYYSEDPETGIPFIRVQNLNTNGDLNTSDVKLINEATHKGMLARSHVEENDLLVKITGVGRMAVSSVPPLGFVGNINQHIARVKTRSRVESRALAAFLNTDIGEALATRRATGGTRPALDYPALRSIPIIYNEAILAVLDQANARRKEALDEADALLASIDDYLLSELGIILPPEPASTIANRMFRTNAHDLGGWRFDPHALEPDVEACRDATIAYGNALPLRLVASFARKVAAGRADDRAYVGLEDIQGNTGILLGSDAENEFGTATLFDIGDVLFPKLRPYLNKVYHSDIQGCCSTEFHVLRSDMVANEFLARFLRSKIIVRQTKHLMTGNTLPRLQTRDIERLMIPIPPNEVQRRICAEARSREKAANALRQEANAGLESAKREIEAILLGDAA
jgi:restriction endonuclease S subunit